jgi:hypothetical protein
MSRAIASIEAHGLCQEDPKDKEEDVNDKNSEGEARHWHQSPPMTRGFVQLKTPLFRAVTSCFFKFEKLPRARIIFLKTRIRPANVLTRRHRRRFK